MPWTAAKAALDSMMERGSPPLTVEFSGGEPLLEPGLFFRCVTYAERSRPSGTDVRLALTTNGLLLTRQILGFLVEHDVTLRLSFDGVAEAQKSRGTGTFAVLDGLLADMARSYPTYFRERVRIQAVLRPRTVPHLARSVRYFLDRGLSEVVFSPSMGEGTGSVDSYRRGLRKQLSEVVRDSLVHWTRTATVPVTFLRPGPPEEGGIAQDGFVCGAGYGKGLCVDSGGRAWTCPMFARSMGRLSPLAQKVSRAVGLGDVRDPSLRERLAKLPERTASLRLLTDREGKHSCYGRCKECEFIRDCVICPGAVSLEPGNTDPDRVPDIQCEFNRATLGARRAFSRMANFTPPRNYLSGP